MAVLTRLDPTDLRTAIAEVATALDESSIALDSLAWDTRSDEEPPLGGPGTDLAQWAAAFAADVADARTFLQISDRVGDPLRASSAGAATIGAFFAGLCDEFRNADHVDAERLALGIELGGERLAALTLPELTPHPGGATAVAEALASGALGALDAGGDLGDVLIEAAANGLVELERGPQEHPGLAELGAVDPLAAGLLVVVDVLAGVVTGEPSVGAQDPRTEPSQQQGLPDVHYEVSCRVEPHPGCGIEEADWLVATWHGLGEVVVFDPKEGSWSATVRSRLPGSVVEAIYDVGRPRELRIAAVGIQDAAHRD